MTNPSSPSSKNELEFAGFRQQFTSVNGLKLCSYTNIQAEYGLAAFEKKTILVLLHGYPQSPYLWRYVAPKLAEAGYPLFIPDLPGYANSPDRTHSLAQDKLTIGTTLLTSLAQHLSSLNPTPTTTTTTTTTASSASTPPSASRQAIILITHDRGSRIGHRLSVSQPLASTFRIKALCTMDIVPTTEQFLGLGRVPVARGYFHWAMLANVDVAVELITGMGGAKWVRDMVVKMTRNARTREAVEVYAGQFDDVDIVRASCRDYEAAALVDVPAQKEDQEAGRKLEVPVLVFWSQAGLGRWFDVEELWRGYIKEGVDAEFCPVGDDAGHYLAEDAPEVVGGRVLEWLQKVDS